MAAPRLKNLSIHIIFTWLFSLVFLILCVAILASTIPIFADFIFSPEIFNSKNEIPAAVVNAISNLIIALAMFELFIVIKINIKAEPTPENFHTLLESAPRFIIVVCVALALEGLVLVIKLIQHENTDDMLAPIAVILSSAVLLISLGIFLKLCHGRLKIPHEGDADKEGSA